MRSSTLGFLLLAPAMALIAALFLFPLGLSIHSAFTDEAGGLTLAQFIVTLRTGHNPNDPPGQILQVMPWPVIGKKTNLDLTAIYVGDCRTLCLGDQRQMRHRPVFHPVQRHAVKKNLCRRRHRAR